MNNLIFGFLLPQIQKFLVVEDGCFLWETALPVIFLSHISNKLQFEVFTLTHIFSAASEIFSI
jgi:hypothetical protein